MAEFSATLALCYGVPRIFHLGSQDWEAKGREWVWGSIIFSTQDGLSWHYNIVNRWGYWEGKTPVLPSPPFRTVRPYWNPLVAYFKWQTVYINIFENLPWTISSFALNSSLSCFLALLERFPVFQRTLMMVPWSMQSSKVRGGSVSPQTMLLVAATSIDLDSKKSNKPYFGYIFRWISRSSVFKKMARTEERTTPPIRSLVKLWYGSYPCSCFH